MPIIEVPNYGQVEFPDGMSDEEIVAAIKKSALGYNAPPVTQESKSPNAGTLSNIALGGLKAASDIGTTLLTPVDWAYDKVTGNTGTHDWRKQQLADFFSQNADPQSLPFKAGELTTDIAGTSGAGGLIGKGLRAIPAVSKAVPSLINSIESGGFVLGKPAASTFAGKALDAATRATGGAVLGGASSGMIDPEKAGEGALIGGLIPGAAQGTFALARGAKNAITGAAKTGIGVMTGTGRDAVGAAYQAGKNGSQTFLDNMRGNVPFTDVIDDAKSALSQMRINRSEAYRNGMADISNDKSVLDITGVLDEVKKLQSMGSYKGQVINKNSAGVVDDISQKVSEWAALNPAEYHTPEGLDALKKAIGDIRESTQFGTGARKAADQVYNKIKAAIQFQAPTYSKVMKDYEEASTLIGEVERALSLGNKASADTTMRKLQSLMRNNVNTNYGNRLSLAEELANQGGKDILPAVAGQAMSSLQPRGMQALLSGGAGLYGLMSNPSALLALPFASPRLMGESAYLLGKAGGVKDKVVNTVANQMIGQAANPALSNQIRGGLLSVAPTLYLSRP